MSKEMNKLRAEVTKYDIVSGLFLSLIIGLILSLKLAIGYFIGILIAVINFTLIIKGYNGIFSKGITDKSSMVFSSIIRILLVILAILPIRNDVHMIIAYAMGLITHYPVLIYCSLKQKGSA